MGWLRSLFVGVEPDLTMDGNESSAQFALDVPANLLEAMTGGGEIAPRIRRNVALQVPAVLRSRNLIAGTLASLPHTVHGPDRREVDNQYLLGGNIDPDIPNSVMLAMTYEDLVFEGLAWWRVTSFGWHGYPTAAMWVPVESVHVAQNTGLLPSQMRISPDQYIPRAGQVFIDGVPVPDRELIRFDSPNPPLLVHAARAIRTCLKLDQAVQLYADDPVPLGYFSPEDDTEPLDETEVQKRLDAWELSRRRRAWGYIEGWKPNELQWDPEKLQLADQRQHAVLEIARAAGVDPEDLGVSTTSRTYQNAEQRRIDLLDFTLGAYVSAMQDRLSMRDVLPRGYRAKVKFAGFLRSDTKTRMETYKIGREVGAYDDERIADLENIPLGIVRRARAQQRVSQPASQPPADREPAMANDLVEAKFASDDEPVVVTFDDEEVYESFSVNAERRTISGMLVPWGKVAWSGMAKWKFTEGSLRWSSPKRVKLNLHHNRERIIAYATRLTATSRGLEGTFKVGTDAESEQALHKAKDGLLDGFSMEVGFEDDAGDDWEIDPSDESVRLVRQAKLNGAALTGVPSFDDARVAAVAASRDQEKVDASQGDRHDRGNGQRSGARVRVRSRYVRQRSGEGGG